jgi:hypothetical protein
MVASTPGSSAYSCSTIALLRLALYKAAVKNNPERLVMLRDRSRILERSDQLETPPQTPIVKS